MSVRWDEEGLESGKVRRSLEREVRSRKEGLDEREREKEREKGSTRDPGRGKERESRRHSDGRKRTPLTAVFPDTIATATTATAGAPTTVMMPVSASPPTAYHAGNPVVTVQEATIDGDEEGEMEKENEGGLTRRPTLETPAKKARLRQRPVSEQLLLGGRSRPQGMYEEGSGGFSFSLSPPKAIMMLIHDDNNFQVSCPC